MTKLREHYDQRVLDSKRAAAMCPGVSIIIWVTYDEWCAILADEDFDFLIQTAHDANVSPMSIMAFQHRGATIRLITQRPPENQRPYGRGNGN